MRRARGVALLLVVLLLACLSWTTLVDANREDKPLTRQAGSRKLERNHEAPGHHSDAIVPKSGIDAVPTLTAPAAPSSGSTGFLSGLSGNSESSFLSAFINAVAMILVTELGDKTFFIAAIMAMRHPRLIVYLGAMGALAGMTVLSAAIGFALPMFLPRIYTHYLSIVLFAFFGFKLLQEAQEMHAEKTPKKNEELEEVEKELEEAKEDESDLEMGSAMGATVGMSRSNVKVFVSAFTLTFLAEWGDRSQIATIALASVHDPIGVTIGGVLGHAACTGLAVLGGRMLATRISEKHVALSGGLLFWVFALHSLWSGP